ncbi:MAG: NADP oxidoreductase [Candidatus Bathyarchaeota archaeon]|nr:NADP oxidoreductase [Candidatus Bathyarchaeota archaeon]
MSENKKPTLAIIWFSGCSGCHMSFLDIDEVLMELAKKVQLVYSPLIDVKDFPNQVMITLIEGAVTNEEQLSMLKRVRAGTDILVALGDCAVTGNVAALRNAEIDGDFAVLKRAYVDTSYHNPQIPKGVPKLLKRVYPLHEKTTVDYYVPGCPPTSDNILYVLTELLAGRAPQMEKISKFG